MLKRTRPRSPIPGRNTPPPATSEGKDEDYYYYEMAPSDKEDYR